MGEKELGVDPMLLLGQLDARVGGVETTLNSAVKTINRVASDISEMKLSHAVEAGRSQAYGFLAKAFNAALVLIVSIVTAYATCQSVVGSIANAHH